MSNIEQRLTAIENHLGLANKDPYAEAKQAWKDGCLQVLVAGQFVDWPASLTPCWVDPPSWYRRKPEEKPIVCNLQVTVKGQLGVARLLDLMGVLVNLTDVKSTYRGCDLFELDVTYTKK